MIYPADEQIKISNLTHSIAVSRDVTTPGYRFPSEQNLVVTKDFLTAGLQGLGCVGCPSCSCKGMGELSLGDMAIVGLLALIVVPHLIK